MPVRRGPFDRPPLSDDSDSEYPPQQSAATRKRKRVHRNPFIETEAGVDGDASADEDDGDGDDLDGFIVDDDVF